MRPAAWARLSDAPTTANSTVRFFIGGEALGDHRTCGQVGAAQWRC
jgi:hypothetical protein